MLKWQNEDDDDDAIFEGASKWQEDFNEKIRWVDLVRNQNLSEDWLKIKFGEAIFGKHQCGDYAWRVWIKLN